MIGKLATDRIFAGCGTGLGRSVWCLVGYADVLLPRTN